MIASRRRLDLTSLCASIILLGACGGGDGGDPAGPTTGALAVVTATTGTGTDAGGYDVTVTGRSAIAVPVSGTTYITGLAPGAVTATLGGVAEICVPSGGPSRNAGIVAGDTVTVRFDVTCTAPPPTGSVRVHVSTVGDAIDADGYTIKVDDVAKSTIGANGEPVQVAGLAPGVRTVSLDGVAANCRVWHNPSRRPWVEIGSVTDVEFQLSCFPAVPGGQILVRTRTMGDVTDPDGFQLTIHGAPSGTLGNNETRTFTGFAAGTYELNLSGGPSACPGGGDQLATVTNTQGAAVEYLLYCYAPATTCNSLDMEITVSSGLEPTFSWPAGCRILSLTVVDRTPPVGLVWTTSGPNIRATAITYGRPPRDATDGTMPVPLVAGHEYQVAIEYWGFQGVTSESRIFQR